MFGFTFKALDKKQQKLKDIENDKLHDDDYYDEELDEVLLEDNDEIDNYDNTTDANEAVQEPILLEPFSTGIVNKALDGFKPISITTSNETILLCAMLKICAETEFKIGQIRRNTPFTVKKGEKIF